MADAQKEREANSEMVAGYLDGFVLDNPEPNANRSHSYSHGFANGRADKMGTVAFASVAEARQKAHEAMELDDAR